MKDYSKKKMYEMFYQISTQLNGEYLTADQILAEQDKSLLFFKSGIEAVDDLLGGGITNQYVFELMGLPGAGKSYFCHSVLSMCVRKKTGGIIYLYLGGSFNAETFLQQFHLTGANDRSEFEARIKSYTYKSSTDLIMMLCCLLQNQKQFNLIVIDNFSDVMLPREDFNEYQQQITTFKNICNQFILQHKIGVVVVSNVKESSFMKRTSALYFDKKSRPKSILPSPWSIVPSRALLIERCLMEADLSHKSATFKYTFLTADLEACQSSKIVKIDY